MAPKMEAALRAVDRGVGQAHVIDGRMAHSMLLEVFTDSGIGTILNLITAQLKEGVSKGFLAGDPAPTVTVPKAAAVDPADKAARTLPGVKFQATLAGAIHRVVISGTLSV